MVTERGGRLTRTSDPRHAAEGDHGEETRAAMRAMRSRCGMAYLVTMVRSSKWVTESALVQTPTRPAARERDVLDFVQLHAVEDIPRSGVRSATRRKVLHWPVGTVCGLPIGASRALDRQIRAPAALDLVQHDVVFERVGAHQVVVVFVLVAPDEPGGLIDATRDRPEAHGDVGIRSGDVADDRHGEP